MAEFIEQFEVSDWEVHTDSGWVEIEGIGKTIEYKEWIIETEDFELICADTHILFKRSIFDIDGLYGECDVNLQGTIVYARDLTIGDEIATKKGWQKVKCIEQSKESSNMYDLQLSDNSDHRYYTDGILSHNSIFLTNIAFNIMVNGHNALLISLEMATWKIIRRAGANAFDIHMKDYKDMAANPAVIAEQLKKFKENCYTSAIPPGQFRLKRFGHATMDDIMALAHKLEAQFGIIFDAIIVDYFTELSNKYGTKSNDMYSYHKQNMDDMYNAGVESNKAMISAHQIKVNGDMSNMSLSSLSESTAIAFRPDNIFAIIQTPIMHQVNEYMLKNIKARDSEYKDYKTTFNIDYSKMRLTARNDIIKPDSF